MISAEGWPLWAVGVLFICGLVLIVKGGDLFVDSAVWIAEVSGIPKFIIGATVVSFATTLPELLVSAIGAARGSNAIAIGNAVGSVTALTLPFMRNGGEIINVCSIAAFAPNTRMAVYCSTKAYVLSLSKALRGELKKRGINVLAVCPGPMDTEFLPTAGIAPGSSHTFDTLPRVNPSVMARKSLAASKKKKGVYTNRLFYKFYRIIAKLLPHSIVMKMCGT